MTTCQKPNVLAIKSVDAVSTPPGARTWLAPRYKISVDKVENTLGTASGPTIDDYKIK